MQGGGARAPMDLALVTGDQSDNQQYNETLWVRQLIEGGEPLTPNSGIKSDYSECPPLSQAELQARETAGEIPDEPTYMGVQDYDDLGFKAPDYYDPDEPFGDQYGTFPTWPGLMDRAQSLTFVPVGLRRGDTPVPTYLSNGNHDGLVQGNEDAVELDLTDRLAGVPVGEGHYPAGEIPLVNVVAALGQEPRRFCIRRYAAMLPPEVSSGSTENCGRPTSAMKMLSAPNRRIATAVADTSAAMITGGTRAQTRGDHARCGGRDQRRKSDAHAQRRHDGEPQAAGAYRKDGREPQEQRNEDQSRHRHACAGLSRNSGRGASGRHPLPDPYTQGGPWFARLSMQVPTLAPVVG